MVSGRLRSLPCVSSFFGSSKIKLWVEGHTLFAAPRCRPLERRTRPGRLLSRSATRKRYKICQARLLSTCSSTLCARDFEICSKTNEARTFIPSRKKKVNSTILNTFLSPPAGRNTLKSCRWFEANGRMPEVSITAKDTPSYATERLFHEIHFDITVIPHSASFRR